MQHRLGGDAAPHVDGPRPVDPARIKPENSYQWADDASEVERARNVDRLAGDTELVSLLRSQDFKGVDYDYAAGELVRYALDVLTAWLIKGTIFTKCKQRLGYTLKPPPAGKIPRDDAESIAGEVVAIALRRFREDVLAPGKWDPARGASLTTYFVGQCIFRLPNVYDKWVSDHPLHVPVGEDLWLLDSHSTTTAIEDDVIRSRASVEALQLVRNPDARMALVMAAMGYSHRQIAEHLGRTVKAVERMIEYGRRQTRKGTRSA